MDASLAGAPESIRSGGRSGVGRSLRHTPVADRVFFNLDIEAGYTRTTNTALGLFGGARRLPAMLESQRSDEGFPRRPGIFLWEKPPLR